MIYDYLKLKFRQKAMYFRRYVAKIFFWKDKNNKDEMDFAGISPQ